MQIDGWLGPLAILVPAAVILVVILVESRRWVQSRRREREMARALRRYLAQTTLAQGGTDRRNSDGEELSGSNTVGEEFR
ncbi:MAG: hypothetical protein RMK57_10840 [Bryobacterales bacterium]|nr:hypothetical protein [Bryobacteraceae bacterium]MDW8355014.1 hypothetical protein [Bryobacterales bacterium]